MTSFYRLVYEYKKKFLIDDTAIIQEYLKTLFCFVFMLIELKTITFYEIAPGTLWNIIFVILIVHKDKI